MSLDTVCRLYEVGRQKLAEEGDDDDQVRHLSRTVVSGCCVSLRVTG